MHQRREARQTEIDREETYIAILANPYHGKGQTIRQVKDRIFGHVAPPVERDDEAIKSMEAEQPEWLRKSIEAGRKKNLELWDKENVDKRAKTTDP